MIGWEDGNASSVCWTAGGTSKRRKERRIRDRTSEKVDRSKQSLASLFKRCSAAAAIELSKCSGLILDRLCLFEDLAFCHDEEHPVWREQ